MRCDQTFSFARMLAIYPMQLCSHSLPASLAAFWIDLVATCPARQCHAAASDALYWKLTKSLKFGCFADYLCVCHPL